LPNGLKTFVIYAFKSVGDTHPGF